MDVSRVYRPMILLFFSTEQKLDSVLLIPRQFSDPAQRQRDSVEPSVRYKSHDGFRFDRHLCKILIVFCPGIEGYRDGV